VENTQRPAEPDAIADLRREIGARRLQQAVSQLPLRYAPFYRRLAELWRLPEPQVEAELLRARDARSWSLTPFPGLRTFLVERGAANVEDRCRLLRFAPGVRFPAHRHRGAERVLVLEGSYADSSGRVVGPGQLQHMVAGSEHQLRILGSVPCVAAVAEHGIDFSGPWLRWVSKLLLR
jgi:anti-sigma factor ChrR (cupin superfamily)